MSKRKTSVTLDEETLAWVEQKIEEKQFASVSHAVEYAIQQLRKQEKP
jgi:Arc/MetJ-type ribon-helix-helix transcriptional regulator